MEKNYLKEVCPKCLEYTACFPNPSYMHICENCGKEYGISEVISVFDEQTMQHDLESLIKKAQEYIKTFPTIEQLRQKRKEANSQ